MRFSDLRAGGRKCVFESESKGDHFNSKVIIKRHDHVSTFSFLSQNRKVLTFSKVLTFFKGAHFFGEHLSASFLSQNEGGTAEGRPS